MTLFRRKTSVEGPAFLRPLGIGRAALKSKRKEILVGIMGLAFSGALLTSLLLLPWRKSRHAVHWQATPCLILKADVRTETHHQGYSFKADLAYSYEFGGTKYVSTQRDFTEWSGLSFANTQIAIEGFVRGTTNVCYVNPYNASQAVLRREFHVDWFMTLFLIAWLTLSAWLVGHGAYRLWLEGLEEALVVTVNPGFHGKSRSEKLQKAAFQKFLLADIPAQVSGTREFVVPQEIMHSFEGVCSRIVWYLKVATFGGSGTAEHEHKIVIRAPPATKP